MDASGDVGIVRELNRCMNQKNIDDMIRFWGVRGSIATPGPGTSKTGGNTSCVECTFGDQSIVFDAGTGLRGLGDHWMKQGIPESCSILLSHTHWDHIQGLPFFTPLYMPSSKIGLYGQAPASLSLWEAMQRQMTAPHFPVRFEDLPSSLQAHEVRVGESFSIGNVVVRTARGNHPGGVVAYRVEYNHTSVVYATDTEHYACLDPVLQQLSEGADILIYDAQYTPEEYSGIGKNGSPGRARVGWGHSTYVAACELAKAANVRNLVLFHHDPSHDDDALDEIEVRARELFSSTTLAREGAVMAMQRGELETRAA